MQALQGLYSRLPVEIKKHGYCIRCKSQKISAGYSLRWSDRKKGFNLPEKLRY
jgi:hypothetical protein